jgi:hypothetical protein
MIVQASAKTLVAVLCTTALLSGCGVETTGETRTETVSFDLDDSKKARVDIRMNSGQLKVQSGTAKFMEGTFAYNVAEWKPVVSYRNGELSLSQPSHATGFGNTVNEWEVKVNGTLPVDLTANLGAGEATLELGQLDLNSVELNIGAGEMKVDLRGEPKRSYSVHIRGGVGETVVYLPKDTGISATATKGIGDISAEGLEQRDGVWINPDRVGAPVTVRLDVKGGIGEIRLIR